jgi:dolichyl-phosphate beta-glucosyltransferase
LERPYLSIVLPAWNEEARVARAIDAALALCAAEGGGGEVIVVDDGSTDATASVVSALQDGRPGLRLLRHPRNLGKGAAVRHGMRAARGRFVLFADVDLSTPFSAWRDLARRHAAGQDVVIASREVPGARRVVPQPWCRRTMGRLFGWLRGRLVLGGFADTQCGFKSFTRDAARRIFERTSLDGFCFDVEVLALARHLGLAVAEVGVAWSDDAHSSVAPLRDSLAALRDLWRVRRRMRRGLYGPSVRYGEAVAPRPLPAEAVEGLPAYIASPGGAHAAIDDPGGR